MNPWAARIQSAVCKVPTSPRGCVVCRYLDLRVRRIEGPKLRNLTTKAGFRVLSSMSRLYEKKFPNFFGCFFIITKIWTNNKTVRIQIINIKMGLERHWKSNIIRFLYLLFLEGRFSNSFFHRLLTIHQISKLIFKFIEVLFEFCYYFIYVIQQTDNNIISNRIWNPFTELEIWLITV